MHAVIAKRIIRHKENQIRRGGKRTPGNTQEIELNHASVKTCRIISPVRLSISSNVRTYFSRVRGLSVSRNASANNGVSVWTTILARTLPSMRYRERESKGRPTCRSGGIEARGLH